jgi:hypothetical protein
MADSGAKRAFHLLDLAALVVGYGMASLVIRAFWPSAGQESPGVLLVILLLYAWLGLAMSGPIVLFRLQRREGDDRTPRHTWAELAWLLIGFYWFAMAAIVVPTRMSQPRLLDAGVFGLFPVLAAVMFRLFRPRQGAASDESPRHGWTHYTGVGLLISWPVAWVAMILLGKTL